MASYFVQAVTLAVTLGVVRGCDVQSAMACVQPILDAARNLGPVSDASDASAALRSMCQTIETLPQCLASTGCAENSDQLSGLMTGLNQYQQQCASLQGEGPEGSCDKISVLGECFGNLQGVDPGNKEEMCRVITQLFECAESHNCNEDDLFSGTVDDAMASIKEARKQCNAGAVGGAAAVAVSFLLMVATSLIMML